MEKKEVKFEEKLANLEELVKKLENGDIPLDEAITNYTKAMELAKSCDEDLKTAEKALSKIVNDDDTITNFDEFSEEK